MIFKFIQNYIWNFLISRFTPTRKMPYIWGLLYRALYRTHERLFVFANERSFFHALKFRTLTCESAYLFILLHKHSIWHFLTSLPKFSTPYKFSHICIIFPHTHVHERLFVVCKFMVNFGIEFSAGWVFAVTVSNLLPFHAPDSQSNIEPVIYSIFNVQL